MSTQRWPFTGALRRVGTWRHLRLPWSITGQRNQRQLTFSISWTRQEPRGLVGTSVISDPAVPGSNSTVENSLFLCHFFLSQSENSEKFKAFHMHDDSLRTCAPVKSIKTAQQVFIGFKNLPAGYYRDLQTSDQSMCSNGHLAIETAINLNCLSMRTLSSHSTTYFSEGKFKKGYNSLL